MTHDSECKPQPHPGTRTHRVDFALVVPHVDVAVHERLVDGDAVFRVDDEHFTQQIARLARLQPVVLVRVRGEEHVREEPIERVAGVAGPVLDVVPHRRL